MFRYGVFSSPYFLVFGLNTENMDQEKFRIWILFTQWRLLKTVFSSVTLAKQTSRVYRTLWQTHCTEKTPYIAIISTDHMSKAEA